MKKILALILALCMTLSLGVMTVSADEETTLTLWCIATESDANRPAYEAAADVVISVDGKSLGEICEELLSFLERKG